jgi:truncated hemoglobin YjbI
MGALCGACSNSGASTGSEVNGATLFDKYGGQATVDAIIELLYSKILAHPTAKVKF